MPSSENKAERHNRHEAEVEENQKRLRSSIAETARLVGETEKMLRRHRAEDQEAYAADAADEQPSLWRPSLRR